ncbi:PIN domain-containing protein [Melanogaster broomeanus]|nr:PIN domain-containing protein [Melanogaster broomeanus]
MFSSNHTFQPNSVLGTHTFTETLQLNATLQSIDEIANRDVEMQGPLAEQLTVIVLDTNILLEFLDIVQTFVSEVEQQQLPVLLIIPGAVIYELDGQKNRNGLSWFARRASTWLLKKVKERRSVKGQALDETCKASGNWKKKEPGMEFGTERTNDSLILDCCQYFFRVRQRRAFLCSKDKILAVEAESVGIPTIFPNRGSFCSRDIAQAVFGHEASKFIFSGYYPIYRSDSMELVQERGATIERDDDGMDIDDDSTMSHVLHPSHALDLLHLQVIDYFSELLLELVTRVAGGEADKFGTPEVMSRHAPSYMRKHLMFWTASDSWQFLNMKKRCPNSKPGVDVFLTKPYEGRGARRGQDWSRRDWEVALGTLSTVGELWEEGSIIRESVPAVEFHVRRVFAMPMRPTGL